MSNDARRWLEELAAADPVVPERLSVFAESGGEEARALVTRWHGEPESRRCLVDVAATCPELTRGTPAAVRLLLLAAREAGRPGPRSLLDRLAAGPASGGASFDLEALAAELAPVTQAAADPEGVLAATIRWILDVRIPLGSLASLVGTARLAAAASRIERRRAAFAEGAALDAREGPLLDSPTWREAVALEGGARADASDGLLAALDTRHVEELVAAHGGLPPRERELALGLLGRLARAGDPRIDAQRAALAATLRDCSFGPTRNWQALGLWVVLDRPAAQQALLQELESAGGLDRGLMDALLREAPAPDQREGWTAVLAGLNRAAFRRGRAVPELLAAWCSLDRDEVLRYLTEELDLGALPIGALAVVVGDLVRAGGERAAPSLRRLAARPDRIGRRAAIGLEIIGASPPEEIERLCAEWRATRSSEALSRLYEDVIEALPAGLPFGPWRVRLGPPTSETGGSIWYHSGDGARRLYLDVGGDERLTSWSLR